MIFFLDLESDVIYITGKINKGSFPTSMKLGVLYTGERVCDVALIEYTLGSGETQEGLGFWKGGYKGPMGDKGS